MTDQDSKLDAKVLLGVSGGIAAYKAVALASKLTACGADVKVVMTDSARELIMPKSFEAVTGNQVMTDLWACPEEYEIGHISLADWANIVVIAPATANIIGKLANGICDDLLSTVLCAAICKPMIVAPAMNNNMWNNPAVQKNIETLRQMNIQQIGPAEGRLACGTEAIGRMSEPQEIIEKIKYTLSN